MEPRGRSPGAQLDRWRSAIFWQGDIGRGRILPRSKGRSRGVAGAKSGDFRRRRRRRCGRAGRPGRSAGRIEIGGFLRFSSAWRDDVGRPLLDGSAQRRRFLRFLAPCRQPARLRPRSICAAARGAWGASRRRRGPPLPPSAQRAPRGSWRARLAGIWFAFWILANARRWPRAVNLLPQKRVGVRVPDRRQVKTRPRVGVPSPWITFGKAASYCSA